MRRMIIGEVALGLVVGSCLAGSAGATPVDTRETVAEAVDRWRDATDMLAQRDRRPPEDPAFEPRGGERDSGPRRDAPVPPRRPDGEQPSARQEIDRRLDTIMQRLEQIERRMAEGGRSGGARQGSGPRPMGPPARPGMQPGPRFGGPGQMMRPGQFQQGPMHQGPHQPGPGHQGHGPQGPGHQSHGPHAPHLPMAQQPGPQPPAPPMAPVAPPQAVVPPVPVAPLPPGVAIAVPAVPGQPAAVAPQVFRFEARTLKASDKPEDHGDPAAHVRDLKEQLERMLTERFEAHSQKAGQGIRGVAEGMERAVGERFEEVRRVLEETRRAVGEQRERAEDTKRRLAAFEERLERIEQALRRAGAHEGEQGKRD